jgi:hypothetical protein
MKEAIDLIRYIKYGTTTDPEFYHMKIYAKCRQLSFVYRSIKEAHPAFAGLSVIKEYL